VNPELRDELALLREDLHPVVASVADVYEAVVRQMNAVKDVELPDVGRSA
jgi:hypothetical protein